MKNDFQSLRGVTIPVIGWNFFRDDESATEIFNAATWDGWNSEWIPIATNGMGDAIVVAEGIVYEVEHGTGEPARPTTKVHDDPESLASFLERLGNFAECAEDDSVSTLSEKRDQLVALKKEAPRPLKGWFTDAIDDAKERLKDARWARSPAGKLQAYVEANYPSWEKEIQETWQVSDLMIRRHISNKAIAVIGSADEDTANAIVEHLTHVSDYPIINLVRPEQP